MNPPSSPVIGDLLGEEGTLGFVGG